MTRHFAGRITSLMLCLAGLVMLPGCAREEAKAPDADEQRLSALLDQDSRGEAGSAEVLLLGRLLIAAGRGQAALDRMDGLKVAEPALDAERQVIRGLALETLTRNGDAYAAYQAALAVSAHYPPALVRLAAHHYRSGDLVLSRRFAEQAIDAWPGAPEAWRYLYVLARTREERLRALQGLVAADDERHTWSAMILRDR